MCNNKAYCKYKQKCEFKHNDNSDERVLKGNEELRNTVKELLTYKTNCKSKVLALVYSLNLF